MEFWDINITKKELKKVLKDKSNPKFSSMAALLLSRSNNPSIIFKDYIDKIVFVSNWQKIKRKMRLDNWNDQRILFWDQIYKTLLETIDKDKIKRGTQRLKNTDVDMQRISAEIKDFRKKKGVTQVKLAEMSGLSQQTISFLERGYLNISLRTFKKIADALELSIELLERDYSGK